MKYKTVKIGKQVWMAENLNFGQFKSVGKSELLQVKGEKFCYDNQISNCQKKGGLYQWHLIRKGGLCPLGWRVPHEIEWFTLEKFLGGNKIAGSKLKGKVFSGNNKSGFNAVSSGEFRGNNQFSYGESYAKFWQFEELDLEYAHLRYLGKGLSKVGVASKSKSEGLAVRCIKNEY